MKLKDIRIEKGYTQKQLADISGVPLRTIQSYEQGARDLEKANIKRVAALAFALKCDINDLITFYE